jgi:hypothetical protein
VSAAGQGRCAGGPATWQHKSTQRRPGACDSTTPTLGRHLATGCLLRLLMERASVVTCQFAVPGFAAFAHGEVGDPQGGDGSAHQ